MNKIENDRTIYFVCKNDNCPDFVRDKLRTVEIAYQLGDINANPKQNCPACKLPMEPTYEGPASELRKI